MRVLLTHSRALAPPLDCRAAMAVLVACVLLTGCGTPGRQKTEQAPPQTLEIPRETLPQTSSGELPPSAFSTQFSRAEQAILNFDWMAAEAVLATIPSAQTSVTDDQYLAYLQVRILYIRGDQSSALQRLGELTSATSHPLLRHKMVSTQRSMNSLAGHYLRSAQLGDQLLQQTREGIEFESLRRAIWRDLLRAKPTQLNSAINAAGNQQWLGWLELAQICLAVNTNFDRTHALRQWLGNHPVHPAADKLPGGMSYLLKDNPTPKKVTLLLPLTGRLAPAAQAVRDGYLANYYATRAAEDYNFEIEVLDVLAYNSASEAYYDAVAGGAEFVIGPLSKQAVEELGKLPERPVPVLALNRIDRPLPPGKTALVQLALAPEDEAGQIATLAFGRGTRKALLVRPAGEWGDKMEQALRGQWQSLGGTISATATYSSRENYSSAMSTALNLPASEQRAREVRSMLATNVEFTARRRVDIDVVFLLSKSGSEARSLKPLLAYHYAADLPVFATSNIYRGIPDARDLDLSGIHLVETPWLLGANPAARVAIAAGGTGINPYTRLNALGADAFLLQTRFAQLQAGEDMLIQGNTGLLSLTPQLHIQRELRAATFDGSELREQ